MPSNSAGRAALYFRAAVKAVWIAAQLKTTKLPRLLARIEASAADKREAAGEAELDELIRIIDRVARSKLFVVRNNCLKKGLLFYYYLLRAGVHGVAIHIGVNKIDSRLDGHCWLTVDGRLFRDSTDKVSEYRVIYSSGVKP